jgi:hypothetical protein
MIWNHFFPLLRLHSAFFPSSNGISSEVGEIPRIEAAAAGWSEARRFAPRASQRAGSLLSVSGDPAGSAAPRRGGQRAPSTTEAVSGNGAMDDAVVEPEDSEVDEEAMCARF